MAPSGSGEAGEFQPLHQFRAGRAQHQLAAFAAGPRRRSGENIDAGGVDQDHAAQVEHDVMVALQDQVAQVLPQLRGRVRIDITAHGDDGGAVRRCGCGLQQWGHGGLLSRGAVAGSKSMRSCQTRYGVASIAMVAWSWLPRGAACRWGFSLSRAYVVGAARCALSACPAVDGFLRSLPPVYYPRRASGGVERPAGAAAGVSGAGSSAAIPLAARTSVGRALLVASAAVAIAIAAAAAVAAGGTTSSTNRSWNALVTPIVEGFIARNQPTWTRRPSTVTRRGALSQASRLSATRVTVPSEASRPAMRSGSSAAGSRERGHHPPSRAPPRASVGSRRSRSPGGADGSAAGTAVVRSLLSGVMSSAPSSVRHGTGLFGTTVASDQQVHLVAANRRRDACWVQVEPGCGQAACAGVGSGWGSGSGMGGCGGRAGCTGQLGAVWSPGWLAGPL